MRKHSVLIPGSVTRDSLAAAIKDGKYQAEPLKTLVDANNLPVNILVDANVPKGVNEVEVHRHEDDLWIAIDGTAYFEVGGTLIEPRIHVRKDGTVKEHEIKAKGIDGGTTHSLSAGDMLYIPAGEPHVHWTDPDTTARLWIIKIPVRDIVPLEEIPGWIG